MILVHRKQLYRNVWGINHLHMQRKQVTCTTFTSKEIWFLRQMRWIIPLLMKSLTVILLFIQKSWSSNCDSLTLFVFVFFWFSITVFIFSGIYSGSQLSQHSFIFSPLRFSAVGSYLVSSPGPTQNWERGLVLLAKIPVCAVSAVFVWSRGITFVHYQLLNS